MVCNHPKTALTASWTYRRSSRTSSRWAVYNRRPRCHCPLIRRPACKGSDPTSRTTCSSAPGGHPAAPTTPTATSPRPPKGLPRPQGDPAPGLRRPPNPGPGPDPQGNRSARRRTWLTAPGQPDRQVQTPRRPAHPLHLAGSRRPEQGHPDGSPRPRDARHGRHLQPCHARNAPAALRRSGTLWQRAVAQRYEFWHDEPCNPEPDASRS